MSDEDKMVAVPESLIEDIHYHLHRYDTEKSKASAGHHLSELFNRVSDLTSWHSGFDVDTGTMPWEREDE